MVDHHHSTMNPISHSVHFDYAHLLDHLSTLSLFTRLSIFTKNLQFSYDLASDIDLQMIGQLSPTFHKWPFDNHLYYNCLQQVAFYLLLLLFRTKRGFSFEFNCSWFTNDQSINLRIEGRISKNFLNLKTIVEYQAHWFLDRQKEAIRYNNLCLQLRLVLYLFTWPHQFYPMPF